MQRALVRLALLMRFVPVLQAAATLALGFSVYARPALGVAAGCLALGWSGWLALRVWTAGRCSGWACAGDVAVGATALLAVGAAMPPEALTTSFYWAATYAAAVALMLGLTQPPWAGLYGLAVLTGAYGVAVYLGAGAAALPAAAGNAAGCVVYFGSGVLAAAYGRRLTAVVVRAEDDALSRQAQLGAQQARLDEFGRLHDEAVQILERVAGSGESCAAELRAYTAGAARHLRAGMEGHPAVHGSVAEVLGRLVERFAALNFSVRAEYETPLPDPGEQALARLAAAITEALNNAHKHAGVADAVMRASRAEGGIEVCVEDSGAGFATGSVRSGFGMTNCIRRRLEEAGGTVEFRSAPGEGTAVRMWLPC
jgi:signal transduction histidine kinase